MDFAFLSLIYKNKEESFGAKAFFLSVNNNFQPSSTILLEELEYLYKPITQHLIDQWFLVLFSPPRDRHDPRSLNFALFGEQC